MRSDLFDVLTEAKAGAPPARLSVDAVVAAGKRRQRRRSTGWGAAAAVVAAAAIAIPQVVTRPTAAPTAAPGVASATTATSRPGPTYPYPPYSIGKYRVGAPTVWTPTMQMGDITDPSRDWFHGAIKIYRSTAGALHDFPGFKTVDTDPVNGQHAFFIEKKFSKATVRIFAWDFGAGVALLQVDPLTLADQRKLAEGFRAAPQPVRLWFQADYLPAGYRLVSVGSGIKGTGYNFGVKAAAGPSISVAVGAPSELGMSPSPQTPTCRDVVGNRIDCTVRSADGTYAIDVSGDYAVGKSELLKILAGVRYDGHSSYLVSEALPKSALPQG